MTWRAIVFVAGALFATACQGAGPTSGGAGIVPDSSARGAGVARDPDGSGPAAGPVDAGGPRLITAAADTDVLSLVRTERLRAKAEDRTLAVYVGAEWCEPCRRFKQELHARDGASALGRVTLLTFDADRDIERLAAAGYVFRSIPFVALPGPDGAPLEADEEGAKGRSAAKALADRLERWRLAAR